MLTLGELMKSTRKERKLTMVQIAKLADCSPVTVAQIESGSTRNPTFYITLRLCAALGLPVELAVAASLYENLPPMLAEMPGRVTRQLEAMKNPPGRGMSA